MKHKHKKIILNLFFRKDYFSTFAPTIPNRDYEISNNYLKILRLTGGILQYCRGLLCYREGA